MSSFFGRLVLSNICHHTSKEYAAIKAVKTVITKPTIWTVSSRGFSDELENEKKSKKIDESRDRRIPIDLDASIQYMNSDAFKQTYRDYKIWQLFRRNFKGVISPSKPRIRCVEDGFITTSNPCVVCRDRYLVVDYKNIELLKHFISPHTGYVYPNTIICLCSEQYEKLCVAVTLAKSYGLIDYDVPLREYNYCHHYGKLPTNFVE